MTNKNNNWHIEITHDGIWPTRWSWKVIYDNHDYNNYQRFWRSGNSFTKDNASRRVAKARASIQNDDLCIYDD